MIITVQESGKNGIGRQPNAHAAVRHDRLPTRMDSAHGACLPVKFDELGIY
ncbi:MAG: hypothetical protein Q7R66_02270 [Undibacterium sp.]|uniref:hypothetical protein n=1 Tax=Undibacterium sp. TaxID=1914977 RepID=UPI00271D443F|nr:hypothetical protein [Undibacterium sp.]MDO8650997.1 hypothetical protein [Undibacterium sp.]